MDKKALKRIIQNYKRNKKRIEEIKRDVYSLSGIDYTKTNAKEKQSYDHMAEMIHRFEMNAERRKLQKEVDAVDRMILRLDDKKIKVYKYYFLENKTYRWIELNKYISKSVVQREVYKIFSILEEEYYGLWNR